LVEPAYSNKFIMKHLVKAFYVLFSLILLIYLSLPNPEYPSALPDSLQSDEPGDTEITLRRAYFTNFDREEVLSHYQSELSQLKLFNIVLPTYRLNYPPEEAQAIIRDQTRSTFLEEVVHPFRESIYINGFKPKTEKDTIIINDQLWYQKITTRFVPSDTFTRVGLMSLALILAPLLFTQWKETLFEFKKVLKN